MNYDIDICLIDNQIKSFFQQEDDKLTDYIKKLEELKILCEDTEMSNVLKNNIKKEIEHLNDKIYDISNKISYNFYIIDSMPILEEYKILLKNPIKLSFTGKKNSENKEKNEIIKRYVNIAEKYYKLSDILKTHPQTQNKQKTLKLNYICQLCNNKKNYQIIELKTYICLECGSQQEYFFNSSSYKDVNRINISSKYTYERQVHFRDCINQYQGKQNSTIHDDVYKDIIKELENHQLVNPDISLSKEERYQRVTKEHILLFLKETGHTKHYENVFLIYNNITGKKLDDISHLEQQLIDDFDVLSALYDKKYKVNKKITRKSFINSQYVLFQLLRRHKHPCKSEDFNVLKTLDRKSFHDDICKDLFEELGWNFYPIF
jgi:hypothetical protein